MFNLLWKYRLVVDIIRVSGLLAKAENNPKEKP